MSYFVGKFALIPNADMSQFQLEYNFGFCCDHDCIHVKAGFETDLASTPRLIWLVYPKTGRYGRSAVIHDYLYQNKGFKKFSRRDCDRIFYQAMKTDHVLWLTRRLMYTAVRVAGASYWNKH